MPKDYYIQPDAPDPVLREEKVLSLARQHVPNVKAVTAVDETGGEARTYAIDDYLIFKTQRPQQLRPRTSLRKEIVFLQQLEGVAGVNVPRVIGYGHPEPFLEYTLMTRMPGIALRNAKFEGARRSAALRDLGRMLRRIHSILQKPLQDSGLFFGDHSPVDVRERMGNLFDDVTAMIQQEGKPWPFHLSPDEVGRRLMHTLPDVTTIVALHSNPGPEHVFVDPASGKMTGVIDFGDAYFSHPVNDLRRFRAPADRQTVLEGYVESDPVDVNFMATWRVACGLADMMAMVYSPEFKSVAMDELDQILKGVA
jgi:aminoglycoside phosphotransferase (APT) family kinase protein